MPAHRLFFALVPPPSALDAIERVAEDLREREGARGRPTRREQLHLTLAFLGDFDDADAPVRALRAGTRAAEGARDFNVVLDRAGSFPGARPPWFLTGKATPLLPLQAGLLSALQAEGFRPKDAGRPFVPHVTLLRNGNGGLEATPITPVAWPAREFVLVDSRTAEHRYVVLQRWPLSAPA
jgi:2'-5' RNA ligase